MNEQGWCTSVAMPLLRRAMGLTSASITALCTDAAAPAATPATAGKGKGKRRSSRTTAAAAVASAAAAASRRDAVHRRVRSVYDSCAVVVGMATDCVALGMRDPEVVDMVKELFGLGLAGAPHTSHMHMHTHASPGAGSGSGSGSGDGDGDGAEAGAFTDVVVSIPPPAPSSRMLRTTPAPAPAPPCTGRGKAAKARGRKRSTAEATAAAAPAGAVDPASRSTMATPLLLQASRAVAQVSKAGMLPAAAASDIVWQVLRSEPRAVLATLRRVGGSEEEARARADAASIRVRPFVSAALMLHTKAGSIVVRVCVAVRAVSAVL